MMPIFDTLLHMLIADYAAILLTITLIFSYASASPRCARCMSAITSAFRRERVAFDTMPL